MGFMGYGMGFNQTPSLLEHLYISVFMSYLSFMSFIHSFFMSYIHMSYQHNLLYDNSMIYLWLMCLLKLITINLRINQFWRRIWQGQKARDELPSHLSSISISESFQLYLLSENISSIECVLSSNILVEIYQSVIIKPRLELALFNNSS